MTSPCAIMSAMNNGQRRIVFLDESVRDAPPLTSVIVGCFIFPYDRWPEVSHMTRSVGRVRPKRRVNEIQQILELTDGAAVMVYANLSPLQYVVGETDSALDVRGMKRTDNVWSQLTADAIATGIAWLIHSNRPVGSVDVYYDRKDLIADHRAAWERMLRFNLPQAFKVGHLNIGAIQGVEEPTAGAQWDCFQNGTNLAHHLCTRSAEVINRGSHGRILVKDRTADTCESLSNFT
jgi:hypothetical protein